jgi:hypothetical protein
MKKTIYVYLEDEGTGVWRPTKGLRIKDDIYLIESPADYDPKIEKWQFKPNTKVHCKLKELSNGKCLVAFKQF